MDGLEIIPQSGKTVEITLSLNSPWGWPSEYPECLSCLCAVQLLHGASGISHPELQYHQSADDTQLSLIRLTWGKCQAPTVCLRSVIDWAGVDKLKLNLDKTKAEFLSLTRCIVCFGQGCTPLKNEVCIWGVLLDQALLLS